MPNASPKSLPKSSPNALPDSPGIAHLTMPIDTSKLTLVYQPMVEARSGRVIAFEALLRQQEADGTLSGPQAVLSQLATPDDLAALDHWVMARACHDACAWRHVGVSVNISASTLIRPGFPEEAIRIVAQGGLSADLFELEVVETGLIEDFEAALANIERLRAAGIRVAMDDFGTGYSSLSYLVKLTVDTIKIDKCFIDEIDAIRSVAVIQATIALARTMGMKVTAEGVETPEQAETLRVLGCHYLQGFHFARPMSVEKIAAFLAGG
jgi:EAL domain-containing protein (putative c-di-GMP-specific phosphodiesterase class I)